jgi:hypothetical protein
MFYVKLKPENNNKGIYEIRSFLYCKIKFETPQNDKPFNALMVNVMAIRETFGFV